MLVFRWEKRLLMDKKTETKTLKVGSGIVLEMRKLATDLMELNIQQHENKITKEKAENILYEYAMKLIDLEEEFFKLEKQEKNAEKDK
jgi:hypothetical protein